jgi:hypothetical protein
MKVRHIKRWFMRQQTNRQLTRLVLDRVLKILETADRHEEMQARFREHQAALEEHRERERDWLAQTVERETAKLLTLLPEWSDEEAAAKGRKDIWAWATTHGGFESSELERLVMAHHLMALRKAMLFDAINLDAIAVNLMRLGGLKNDEAREVAKLAIRPDER